MRVEKHILRYHDNTRASSNPGQYLTEMSPHAAEKDPKAVTKTMTSCEEMVTDHV